MRRLWLLLWLMLPALSWAGPGIVAVDSVGIPVSNLERAEQFYTEIFGFTRTGGYEVAGDAYEHLYGVFGLRLRAVRLKLGDESIELMQFLTPRGRPLPADSRSNDRWFQHIAIIVTDMDRAYERLRSYHVEFASSGPQRLPDSIANAAGIQAFYFRDPEGNFLEILQFPPGKGAARWQRRDGSLFLGIDHTAVVVADTEQSLRYYRDALGFTVAGGSENFGTEQEHLNNIFGAHLRITTLRAAAGPGIELLEYLAPRDGRPAPADTRANDGWAWQVNMRTAAPAALRDAVLRQAASTPASALEMFPGAEAGFHAGFLLHDPDGHAALIEAQ